jgi:glycosyltransferase involved in cell wall biosynthesis
MIPRVSVVMPVYNVAPHVEATISSVLAQTFTDFELLVLDDCSTDGTAAVVQAMRDPRIRFIQNARNLGRAGTDNAALPYVRGEYIAKMDGDDLCHPERLARQVAYLDSHPDVNVMGAWMQNFGASTYLNRYPTTPAAAQVLTLFTLPTGNPSVMLRTRLFREQGMTYDGSLRQTEDYDFFARYVRALRIATLPEALIQYRVPPDAVKTAILTERATVADEVRERLLRDWGVVTSERELRVHNTIAMLGRPLGDITLAEVEAWLRKLIAFNDQQPLFEPAALRQGLGERWFEVCYTHPQRRLGSVRHYGRSPLAAYFSLSGRQQLKFWLQAISRF